MLRLFLRDPISGITVDAPNPEEPWSMRQAVADLVNKVTEHTGAHAAAVMFQNEPFQICAEEIDALTARLSAEGITDGSDSSPNQ